MKKPPEEFTERSVMTTASNCDLGHCGCYYTLGNVCCRCRINQLPAKEYLGRTIYEDRPFRKRAPKPQKSNKVIFIGERDPVLQ